MRLKTFFAFSWPALLLMFGLLVVPLGYTLVWSFQHVTYGSGGNFAGLANYLDPWRSPRFRDSLWLTLGFTAVATTLLLAVGYGLALLLQASGRARPVYLGLLLVPFVVPLVVGSVSFAWLFNDVYGGPVSGLLASWGLHVGWLSSTWPARTLIVLSTVWSQVGFPALVLLAGLQSVPDEQLEAATIDGANWFQRQWHVVFPHLSRLFALCTIILVMDNLRVFDQIQMITPSAQTLGTESVLVYVYNVALGDSQQLGLASAVSVITMVITFIFILPMLRQTYRDVRAQ